jgi:hypothetical protein
LLEVTGILFTAKPGKAEGRTEFFINGATTELRALQRRADRSDTGGRR